MGHPVYSPPPRFKVDRSTSEAFFGSIIAIYSLGQILASPTFGYWSNRIHQVRLPLYVGFAMMFLGNALYIGMELVPVRTRYMLLLGRFITGVGSGNVVLLRTYASTASTSSDRSRAIVLVTCGQAIGMTSGPALQLLFAPLFYPGIRLPLLGTSFNLYTAPAYLACGMNLLGALALRLYFCEEYAGLSNETLCHRVSSVSSYGSSETVVEEDVRSKVVKLSPYDLVAVAVIHLTRFTQMFVNTNLETIGSPFSMAMFGWTESEAVVYTAMAQSGIGLLTLVIYATYILFRMERM